MPFDVNNLVYRGDSREWAMIFPFGFTRRKNTWAFFEKLWQEYLNEALETRLQDHGGSFRRAFGFTPKEDSEIEFRISVTPTPAVRNRSACRTNRARPMM